MEGSKICVCTDGDASLGKEKLGRECTQCTVTPAGNTRVVASRWSAGLASDRSITLGRLP